jgi:hypothetical protein
MNKIVSPRSRKGIKSDRHTDRGIEGKKGGSGEIITTLPQHQTPAHH